MLDLSHNRIQALPADAFIGLSKLKNLKLSKNKLIVVPNDILQSLERLEELDLSNNEISIVESGGFQGVPKLRVVRFNNNKLKFGGAPNDFFGSYSPLHLCINLEELWLANNSLTEVFADWRLSMLKLRTLDLSYNNFTYVSVS
jgi:protein toll